MNEIIARIKLAPGELGYYDELSGTFLTPSNPIKDIVRGTNCDQLRRSAQCHRISVIAGSLGKPLTIRQILKLDPVDYNYSYLPALNKPVANAPAAAQKEVQNTAPEKPAAAAPKETVPPVQKAEPSVTAVKSQEKETVQLAVTPTSIRSLKVGNTRMLTSNLEGATFKSQDEKIATVTDKGEVKGIAVGKTVIAVTASKQTVEISVNIVEAEAK